MGPGCINQRHRFSLTDLTMDEKIQQGLAGNFSFSLILSSTCFKIEGFVHYGNFGVSYISQLSILFLSCPIVRLLLLVWVDWMVKWHGTLLEVVTSNHLPDSWVPNFNTEKPCVAGLVSHPMAEVPPLLEM